MKALRPVLAAMLILGCSDNADPNEPGGDPNANVVSQVRITLPTAPLNAIGATLQATAQALNGTGQPVTGVTFTWASSNAAVATVSPSGLITAVKDGVATISATASGVAGTAAITVSQTVATIAITPGTVPSFNSIGDTLRLSASARDSRNNVVPNITITWSSGDSTKVRVNSSGRLTAVANGSATITAAGGGRNATVSVTVAQAIATVNITPQSVPNFVSLGQTFDLDAVAVDSNGNTVTGSTITWSSLATGTATVSSSGLITSVNNGSTWIRAVSGTGRDSVFITVSQVTNNVLVTCSGSGALTTWGAQRQCSATVRDARNQTISGATPTWSSSNTGVAVVSASGLVSARDNGTSSITATHNTVSGSQTVTVDLKIAYGTPVTGTILGSELHEYDITGGGTTTYWVSWVHRNPYGTSGLNNPRMFVSNSSFSLGGVVAGRNTTTSEVLARAAYPNNLATSYLAVYGESSTTGGYAMGISECAVGATMTPGTYSWGVTNSSSCAFLNGAGGSTPNFTSASIWPVNLTAGVDATIEVVVGCNPGATNNLSCTAPGGNLSDPYIYLFGPNNGQVWSDDDGAGNLGSRITLTPPTTGTYTLVITSHTAGQVGVHSICIFQNCATNAGAPPAGGPALTAVSPAMAYEPAPARTITVRQAYALLEAHGMLPVGFDWRRVQPVKD